VGEEVVRGQSGNGSGNGYGNGFNNTYLVAE
jgi:hypothetical protein